MFGIVRRRKPLVHAHWYVPLMGFRSDAPAFYEAVGRELIEQEVPGLTVERIGFRQGGILSSSREYLRLRRERFVMDICSAPFGKGWWFSARPATLARTLRPWELVLTILGLLGFALLDWQLFGPVTGGILFGSSLLFLVLAFLAAGVWSGLDEFLVYLPVVGAFYEGYFRRDTYYRQDQRLMYGETVEAIVRSKVREFCFAGGVEEPRFVNASPPEQILSVKELADYFEMRKDV